MLGAANEIIEKKASHYYGIGLASNRLLQAIFNDENCRFYVSHVYKKRRVSTKGFIYRGSSNF